MGRVAILHPPQPFLKNHPHMKSPPTIKFMNPPSQTPNFTAPGSRRRTPPKGILKKNNRNTAAVTTELTASKNLVMGQVKILKRGEPLNTVLKDVNDRKVSNAAATTPENRLEADREASEAPIGRRRVSSPKKKAEKDKNLRSKFEASKAEDVVLCSTHRLGPDPEIVSKQMKDISDCFAGSAFSDSPPPSSVPLPGFFRKSDDATTNLRRILGLSLV